MATTQGDNESRRNVEALHARVGRFSEVLGDPDRQSTDDDVSNLRLTKTITGKWCHIHPLRAAFRMNARVEVYTCVQIHRVYFTLIDGTGLSQRMQVTMR